MTVLATLHEQGIHPRRVRVLADHLASLMPAGARVLDVGCGDGQLAHRLAQVRPDLSLSGLDVMVRPNAAIEVTPFDGSTIPLPDHFVDVVMFVDVLHHTHHPLVLLREAARVARQAVVLKDHLDEGFLSTPTLRLMDWVGNARHGVSLPYSYWSRDEWNSAFMATGLAIDAWRERLSLYPSPASLVFDRSLHFIARLIARRGPRS